MRDAALVSLEECEGLLDVALKEGAAYADLKLYVEHGSQVALRATSSDVQTFDRTVGVARVVYGKAWGIHVLEKPSRKSLGDASISALRLARSADSTSVLSKPIKLAEVRAVKSKARHDCRIDPLTVEMEQKVSLTKDLAARAEEALKEAYGWSEVVYGDIQSVFSLLNNEGTYICEITPSVDLLLYVTARSSDIVESASKFIGSTGGYEVIEEIDRDNLVKEVAERALRLASGKMLRADLQGQKSSVVMDADCAGALVHEAVGHPAEADFMMEAGSVFENKMGERVAVEELTVLDDANFPRQYGSYLYDDEGVRAGKTCIIEKGLLRSLLHTRETASEMNAKPTGSAHGLTHVPRCLMSNIYIEPRDWKHGELIEETKNGIYIQGVVRAQSTPVEGLFMIQPESATIIHEGSLRETIRGARITGKIQETLNAVEGIGNRLSMRATVEKEFNISDGGPPIRVSSLRVY